METSEENGEYCIRKGWKFVRVKPSESIAKEIEDATKVNRTTNQIFQQSHQKLLPDPDELCSKLQRKLGGTLQATTLGSQASQNTLGDGSLTSGGLRTYSVKEILMRYVPDGVYLVKNPLGILRSFSV